ncbi:hypothetical protein GIB67_009828 [Kingdonia uniflora]|uniref:Protein kinase domain-containing protein n=1 Tax=Kingdonia uniflora TaxID=39325 RepID=A0A7J7LMH6_9MAGN|nr:hypothetical protein GIB67_009828 [Kingdonia uniflora]
MVWLFVGFFVLVLGTSIHAKTDAPDVSALGVMYTSLNSPSQLTGWKSSGGDPCGQDWQGITCSGSSVTEMTVGINGVPALELDICNQIYSDMSKNNLKGDIPYQLPPNALNIDLSGNGFTGGVPYSVSQMSDLKYLDLGHNQLSGQLSDMFGKLSRLSHLDLSFNSLTGNLPNSFGSLSSLGTLHLENNQFTGRINVLAKLPLDELNVMNNQFSGSIPNELKEIGSIETGGNSWSSGSGSSSNKSSKHSSKGEGKSGLNGIAIAGIVIGALVALAIIIALFSCKSSSSSSHFLDEERLSQRRAFTPLVSRELSIPNFKELQPPESSAAITVKALHTSPSMGLKPPPSDRLKSFNGSDFANKANVKRSMSIHAVTFSLSDLQSATGNFASARLLGEGTIGRVYRAKYADGKVLAVKKIDSSLFQYESAEVFTEMISNISKLHQPNIAELVGYCSEQGHNLLVYEYFRNGSLHDFLHLSDDYSKPLTWNTRIRIALGTARGVEYLHEVCSPSSIHKNIKSSNILLDTELNPRLSDCGLAIFHQRTSQNLGVGYNAPECTKPSAYTLKSDVYSFGVVMLELLTGRKPYDSSKPRPEQSLVWWATPQLHDIDALAKMVDPALRGLYPPKSLSRFADVIALCVQSEPEFRPAMSEVVQALVRLIQRSSINKRGDDPNASRTTDDLDQSDYY